MRRKLKKVFITFLAITLLSGLNLSGAYASTEIADNVTSNATFDFNNEDSEDTDKPTPPVDPELPDYEIDPDDNEDGGNGSTGNTGRLRIDYVSDFSFGAHSIESGEQTFYASLISADADHGTDGRIKVPNFVQVSDLRGSGAGWTLSVKQDDYFKMVSGTMAGTTFKGMEITLHNIIPNTVNESGKVHVPNTTLHLNTMDEYKEVMVAGYEKGIGTHVAHFGEYEQGEKESALEAVELYVPGDDAKIIGKYKASLTWRLSSVPSNGGNDVVELDYISITTAPDNIDYTEGEAFDPAGMVVTAYYTDDSSREVTDYNWSPAEALTIANEFVTISYTEDEITRTAEQAITVTEPDIGTDIDDTDELDTVEIDGDEWIILSKDEDEGTAELLRRETFSKIPYHRSTTSWQWSTSYIRSYLNSTFKNTLSPEFRQMIISVNKKTSRPGFDPYSGGDSSSETIYLLSLEEFEQYGSVLAEQKQSAAFWYLRTPDEEDTKSAYAAWGNSPGTVKHTVTTEWWVRPALTVKYK